MEDPVPLRTRPPPLRVGVPTGSGDDRFSPSTRPIVGPSPIDQLPCAVFGPIPFCGRSRDRWSGQVPIFCSLSTWSRTVFVQRMGIKFVPVCSSGSKPYPRMGGDIQVIQSHISFFCQHLYIVPGCQWILFRKGRSPIDAGSICSQECGRTFLAELLHLPSPIPESTSQNNC